MCVLSQEVNMYCTEASTAKLFWDLSSETCFYRPPLLEITWDIATVKLHHIVVCRDFTIKWCHESVCLWSWLAVLFYTRHWLLLLQTEKFGGMILDDEKNLTLKFLTFIDVLIYLITKDPGEILDMLVLLSRICYLSLINISGTQGMWSCCLRH